MGARSAVAHRAERRRGGSEICGGVPHFYFANPANISYFPFMNAAALSQSFAQVVFPVPVDHAYTYLIPGKFQGDLQPGMRVLAEFGPRKSTGFVVSLSDTADRSGLKEIEEVLDPVPLFTPEVLELARWIAQYYLCGWGEVLKAALPSGIHKHSVKVARLTCDDPARVAELLEKRAPRQAQILRQLTAKNPLPVKELTSRADAGSITTSLTKLRQAGFIRYELMLPRPRVGQKFENFVQTTAACTDESLFALAQQLRKSAPRQAALLDYLCQHTGEEFGRSDLAREARVPLDAVTALEARGILDRRTAAVQRDYYGALEVEPPQQLSLNAGQQEALRLIGADLDRREFTTALIHGVTGSGKTQVYIEAIARVIAAGGAAIVLVPEIALTPQMVRRFRSHFGRLVAVFHSRMSPGERYDSWRATWEGRHRIVIGPRSAIFAPLADVRLIVVDEEHEPSYKQNDLTPRYHARDVAVMRAKLNHAVIVLGSATPSLESFYNARSGKYQLISMPSRIDDVPMPPITFVDMRSEPKIIGSKEPVVLSRFLRQKIDEKLARGEQIILFQNRRGFATLFKCSSCGYTAECENCSISLTYHLRGRLLKCHYCGFVRKAPEVCPQCGGLDLYFRGIGTQRIEEELKNLFPGIKAVRMDLDTTRGKHAHDRILTAFGRGEYQILLGTQMVAKGLDFPRVTLVGVISADSELYFPDFRAGERTFQLLTQVAGRAGRKDRLGEVVIQTFSPDHPSLFFVSSHDYPRFYDSEIKEREGLGYPPFSRMTCILFKGEEEAAVQRAAEGFARFLRPGSAWRTLGPAPAPLARIEGLYRYQMLLMSLKEADAGGGLMKSALRRALEQFHEHHRARGVQISIDVDPISIM
ncbi:MAG TPA: primosomal protein N' [bacterium]|nr:primosomal protein N' [bacterium]HPR88223.1 primosomal protein N' [bacterium]